MPRAPEPPPAQEVELKFEVPPAARAAVRRAVGTATARTVRLQAIYADTADERLAGAGLALRLRREDRRWVQTLKGRGSDLMTRLEHEVALPPVAGRGGTPALDPARHAGTPVGDALAALLADGAPLEPRYRTDVQRLWRRVRSGAAVVEIAFDEGRIVAGGRSLPVCELEFELVSGPPAALLALAERWVQRFRLRLDTRTKSERGHRLAAGWGPVPATTAAAAAWPRRSPPAVVWTATLQSALAHLLPNTSEIVAGDGTAEHLHQARVALRRLRTALRLLADWSADPATALRLEAELRQPFGRLGAARDSDALSAGLLPELQAAQAAAGAALALPAATNGERPEAVLAEPAFTRQVLQVLQLALTPAPTDTAETALDEAAARVLQPLWRRVAKSARGFAEASDDERHRLRRRLKRLRYLTEFLLPALPKAPARQALAAMRRALGALGAYNDVRVAEQRFRDLLPDAPQAWFALGWLAARRERLLRRAARQLQALARRRRYWR